MKTAPFAFEHNGNRLVGVVDLPDGGGPTAIVVFVGGDGRSNIDSYHDLRQRFTQLGMACCAWEKPGCGQSSGEYRFVQAPQASAREVVSGIDALASLGLSGAKEIGLWGFSRGGQVCPLVIAERPSVAFWISVSGPGDKEDFHYQLETNLRIEGKTESEVRGLMAAWQRAYEALLEGAPHHRFLELTRALRQDPFYGTISAEFTQEFYAYMQARLLSGEYTVDEGTGLMVYVPGFTELLGKIGCPVLAIFGEKDSHLDWRKSAALYREAIGGRPGADLTIVTFPDGNHGIAKCVTGGTLEPTSERCDGYYDMMTGWLLERGFGRREGE